MVLCLKARESRSPPGLANTPNLLTNNKKPPRASAPGAFCVQTPKTHETEPHDQAKGQPNSGETSKRMTLPKGAEEHRVAWQPMPQGPSLLSGRYAQCPSGEHDVRAGSSRAMKSGPRKPKTTSLGAQIRPGLDIQPVSNCPRRKPVCKQKQKRDDERQ